LFLQGLKKRGKGDWKSISRNFVISRTPSQVASHAQKYYIRHNSENTKRRRPSILDITSVDNGEASAAQGTVTGTNGQAALPGNSLKQPAQPANLPPGVDAFGTTIGQPFGGPLVSAVGTPATLHVPAPPHMANGMHAPVPGTMVPRAPVPGTMVPRAPVPGTMAPRAPVAGTMAPRAPVPGTMVPRAPINIPYPMPPPSSRRWPPS
jgi:SHAQKYF class myb-like DNA-binding protein